MNRIIESIFEHKKVLFNKLLPYGFIESQGVFVYNRLISDGQMDMTVRIDREGKVSTQVYDKEAECEYTLFLAEEAFGSFVGKIREEYQCVLSDIAEKCFDRQVFKKPLSLKIIEYIREKYGDELEFLWDSYPTGAILRRKDNRKWYAVFMTVKAGKLGLDSDDLIEVMNLRVESENLENILDGMRYFRAYHMNKNNWISINMDASANDFNELCTLVDRSYELALGRKKLKNNLAN